MYKKYLKYKYKYLFLKNKLLNKKQRGGDTGMNNDILGITNYFKQKFNNLETNINFDKDIEPFLNPIYGVLFENNGFITNQFHLYDTFIRSEEGNINFHKKILDDLIKKNDTNKINEEKQIIENLTNLQKRKNDMKEQIKNLFFNENVESFFKNEYIHYDNGVRPSTRISGFQNSQEYLKLYARLITHLLISKESIPSNFIDYYILTKKLNTKNDSIQNNNETYTKTENTLTELTKTLKDLTDKKNENKINNISNIDVIKHINKITIQIKDKEKILLQLTEKKSRLEGEIQKITLELSDAENKYFKAFDDKYNKYDNITIENKLNIYKLFYDINSYIINDPSNKTLYFHILLYIIWWNTNTNIKLFIDEIINTFSDTFQLKEKKETSYDKNLTSFEKNIYHNINKQIVMFKFENSNACCDNQCTYIKNFPNCGEINALNFMNFILYNNNNNKFNLPNNINEKCKLFYQTFDTFDKQKSKVSTKINIDNNIINLNAIDFWNYIIIHYANTDLSFVSHNNDNTSNYRTTCSNNIKYELNDGYNILGEQNNNGILNFYQLITNLLPDIDINDWNNKDKLLKKFHIINNDITNIEFIKNNNKYGSIKITKKQNDLTINFMKGHYDHIYNEKPIEQETDNKDLNDFQKTQLSYLKRHSDLNFIIDKPLLFFNYDNDNIYSFIHKSYLNNINNNILFMFIILSLTKICNKDTRSRIIISIPDNNNIIKLIQPYMYITQLQNEYDYKSNTTDFVKELNITHLNFNLLNENLEKVDLSPLSNLQTIGNGFMNKCTKLKEVDLSPLSNVTSIGNDFMKLCNNLTKIDLSRLTNLQTIGNDFMKLCNNLTKIDLSRLTNLQTIGYGFINNCSNLEKVDLSGLTNLQTISYGFINNCSNLEKVDLSGLTNLQTIGSYFINNCSNLEKVDLSGLTNLQTIGNDFMYNCSNLKEIDLSGLSNLKTIGNDFMARCKKLTTIKLSGLSNLLTINDNFMIDCNSLTTIDLSSLNKVTSIGTKFMHGCEKLNSIDLSPFSNVTSIGTKFMHGCEKLNSIDLSPFSNVTSIGNNFMDYCRKLTIIDLSNLTKLESIRDDFMYNCSNLKEINLSGLSNLQTIGSGFMYNCSNLEKVHLSGLNNVTSIGNNFMNNCSNLEKVDLSPLSNVTSIGNDFMKECDILITIKLSGFSNVTSIGNDFMNFCSKLTTIDLSGFSNVTSIRNNFMFRCSNLKEIDLSGLTNLQTIGNDFMKLCNNLTKIDLSRLTNLQTIGYGFMNNCSNLKEVDLSRLSNLQTIGNSFMNNCESLTEIDLSGLTNLQTIGYNFMNNYSKLKSVKLDKTPKIKYDNNKFIIN
jgi:hypothetical protein